MKTELQKAQELKEKWCSPLLKPWEYSEVLTEAKFNLESLGCGKIYLDIDNKSALQCGFFEEILCQDCQQAKEIYERILK